MPTDRGRFSLWYAVVQRVCAITLPILSRIPIPESLCRRCRTCVVTRGVLGEKHTTMTGSGRPLTNFCNGPGDPLKSTRIMVTQWDGTFSRITPARKVNHCHLGCANQNVTNHGLNQPQETRIQQTHLQSVSATQLSL